MIGRFFSDLTPSVAALAGQPMRLTVVLYADTLRQQPSDLSGFAAAITLLDADDNVLVSASTANSGITIDGPAGLIAVDSSNMAAPHAAIPAGAHRYALELYNASNVLELYITGAWVFDVDVSP